jgi:uncharacterized Fe-S cluster protein YjdI
MGRQSLYPQRQLREEATERVKVENAKFVINGEGASEDAIKTVVAECPSGALKIVDT